MIHFEEICNIKVNDCTIYNFKETVEYIIRDQTYREQNFNWFSKIKSNKQSKKDSSEKDKFWYIDLNLFF